MKKTVASQKNHNPSVLQIKDSIAKGELIVVIGTGVSIGLTDGKFPQLSWTGLVSSGLTYAHRKGFINESQFLIWQALAQSSDVDELVTVAEFLGRKLGSPNGEMYDRWLHEEFSSCVPTNRPLMDSLKRLKDASLPISTLNYDTLIEHVTGLQTVTLADTKMSTEWARRPEGGILHLHGAWTSPPTCVLGARDYESAIKDDARSLLQRSFGAYRRMLFIGCGDTFADPNFVSLNLWLRANLGAASLQHYALVTTAEATKREKDPTWRGFVEPVGYGNKHSDLSHFIGNLIDLNQSNIVNSQTLSTQTTAIHHHTLDQYRQYILRDCGQMTIEGMRADIDMAQRKFNIEQIFVPLDVQNTPPTYPQNDPLREKKLVNWLKRYGKPRGFGATFESKKRLALLAFPGGGKTLLLKRLAVAYANPDRRSKSDDDLPDLDLLPILIRCREWRDHIRLPFMEIFARIHLITGQPDLNNFRDAIASRLKSGKILLLVDGLDEIHNDADRATFVDNMESFLESFPDIRLVVTSREAGFSLVAPTLARFCAKVKVAPLSDPAIKKLCAYWHRLMVGMSPEATQEANKLSDTIINNNALRRLAENPLLLTMLLVVKHGAGRLPPDRVALYERAVEVLLDTWNIKGHDSLNVREAVPQLAYIALEMMRTGKQTATKLELLRLLEAARNQVDQIKRYAKDTPEEFLRRVELRSSLLVEAGHQIEGARSTPFYQFRHLTFQEYLAALAAAEGHYSGYSLISTPLSVLQNYLVMEEWKEVIPMATVVAKKQAEPIITELLRLSDIERREAELKSGSSLDGVKYDSVDNMFAPATMRLTQCFIEESEASTLTLSRALSNIAYFAHGCRNSYDWISLSRGPYGEELIHQAWLIYQEMTWAKDSWIKNTIAMLEYFRSGMEIHRAGTSAQESLADRILGGNREDSVRGILLVIGALWPDQTDRRKFLSIESRVSEAIERQICNNDRAIFVVATWARMFLEQLNIPCGSNEVVANRLMRNWLDLDQGSTGYDLIALGLGTGFGLLRESWTPRLTEAEKILVRMRVHNSEQETSPSRYNALAAVVVAFYARNVVSDSDLLRQLELTRVRAFLSDNKLTYMISELGGRGEDGSNTKRRRRRPH